MNSIFTDVEGSFQNFYKHTISIAMQLCIRVSFIILARNTLAVSTISSVIHSALAGSLIGSVY